VIGTERPFISASTVSRPVNARPDCPRLRGGPFRLGFGCFERLDGILIGHTGYLVIY
jgi:hypothetical protein